MDFKGKTVVLTGASQGIGATLAVALGRLGANVVCAARNREGLEATVAAVKKAGGDGLAVPTDVAKQSEVDRMIAEAAARFGGIDALVNNAALIGNITSLSRGAESFEREMAVNLYGALYGILAVRPHLKKRKGSILNVSSQIALNLMPGMFAYGVSKLALERLTLDVANELKEDGVRCNALRIDVGVLAPDWKPDPTRLDPDAVKRIEEMRDYFEPLETGAAAMIWMLQQGAGYTGVLESLRDMIVRKSITGKAKKLMPLDPNMRWSW